MAKLIEYNVEGVEESSGGTGVKAPPKLYVGKIMLCEKRDVKADGQPANDIRLGISVGEEFDWLFTYIGLGPESDWKLAEFVRALGLKDKGKINPEKIVKDGTLIRVKVNPGEYLGEYSPQAGRLMKAQPGDEWGSGASELSSSNGAAPVAEEATGDEPLRWRENEPDPENPDTIVTSYDEWSDDDLEAEVTDRELTIPGGRGSKTTKLIAALRADDLEWAEGGGASVDPANGQSESGTTDGTADDYDDWELDRLKTEWDARQLGDLPVVRGSGAADRLRVAIVEALRTDDAENPFEG